MNQYRTAFWICLALSALFPESQADEFPVPLEGRFELHGELQTAKLDEASGMVAGENGLYYMHNDDGGSWLYAMGADGTYHGRFRVLDAKNKDWEDITRVPGPDGPLLVVADSGDNQAGRKDIELYFVKEPSPDNLRADVNRVHKVNVSYQDGPRDVEAVAYDPASRRLMFLSKRDQPPRLYAVPLEEALEEEDVTARFVAEVPGFRPPTQGDFLASPTRGLWVSQPTGLDFSPDGHYAAVITYRSLYLFERAEQETWEQAFQKPAIEYLGPPGFHDEAVAFDPEGRFIYVTTEKRPAPIHRIPVPASSGD